MNRQDHKEILDKLAEFAKKSNVVVVTATQLKNNDSVQWDIFHESTPSNGVLILDYIDIIK